MTKRIPFKRHTEGGGGGLVAVVWTMLLNKKYANDKNDSNFY